MTQKVLKVGSSAGVTIPKKALEKLGLKIGDEISVEVSKNKQSVTIKPAQELSRDDVIIARLTNDFINRYEQDLKSLAKK
ncbi:MAG: hypothetical protein COU08_02820 [Candidatus Harrisonbacteria bacterium CG10_big_fil_rev_8_21_14_0_10_42_17]|uniref:SpoVT-AbrB domain-containing protein n=1 Tax=Candidatus Harrisonbacteria bacterium CG10_big_fil_rev_8_21_14_0_10_42_17 TaxID=1974584 RepID=A0A2M6WHY9_9BACT|nr:MAG: hypothetical protein COU08_02820 [Candidatus Harrisonbacteria bacterium CG10_big_fil_rev_8_21_14_0_10_42_17]